MFAVSALPGQGSLVSTSSLSGHSQYQLAAPTFQKLVPMSLEALLQASRSQSPHLFPSLSSGGGSYSALPQHPWCTFSVPQIHHTDLTVSCIRFSLVRYLGRFLFSFQILTGTGQKTWSFQCQWAEWYRAQGRVAG